MLNNTDHILETKPPQVPHVPAVGKPIVLSAEDAEEFYQKLEEVRALLPEDQKHFLKKDRELAELKTPNTQLIGIKDEFGNLVAGVMVLLPVTRMIAKKYMDYPFDANAENTALLSALWTDAAYRKRGLAVENIQKVIQIAKEAGMSNVLTGIADKNPVSSAFVKATENADKKFMHVQSRMRPASEENPEYLMHYHRVTFFTPNRLPS